MQSSKMQIFPIATDKDKFQKAIQQEKQQQKHKLDSLEWNQMAGEGLLPDIHNLPIIPKQKSVTNTDAKEQEIKKTPVSYNLYGTKKTHPIIEYRPSKEDSESATLTPSFVLEVTWPRIVQFYHPSSPKCQSLQPIYVSVARGIKRRSSRLPVEFHSVNCGIYREVCEQRFNIKSVPTIIGLRSGRIEGSEITLPGSMDLSTASKRENEQDIVLKVEFIAHAMGIPLDALKGAQAGNTFARPAFDHIKTTFGDEHDNALSEVSIPLSEEVFHDAQSSFLATLTSSLYSQFPTGRALPPNTTKALSDFLDLIRWAHPPETKMHDLAEDLHLDFASVSMSEEGLMRAIRRNADIERGITWSPRCGSDPKGGYACGLWSLLHILSVGVAERHASVVGDADSVTVVHAGEVMRSFIDNFFIGCDSCKKSWLAFYDEAAHSTDHPMTGSKEEWRSLAIWIWQVHNDVTIHREQSAGKGYYRKESRMASSSSLWPTKHDCKKCWSQSMTDDTGSLINMDSYDRKQLYYRLKKIYWPGGIHNNRLIVLERWSKAKRALSMKRLRERMANHEWTISTFIFQILVLCIVLRVLFPRRCIRFTNRECLFMLYRHDRRILQRKHRKKAAHTQRRSNGNGYQDASWDDKSHSSASVRHSSSRRRNGERYDPNRYDNGRRGDHYSSTRSIHHRPDEGGRRRKYNGNAFMHEL